MDIEKRVKDWVTIDNRLKLLNEEMRDLRDKKRDYENDVLIWATPYVDQGQKPTIKISDGKLRIVETKQTQPLSMKFIEECLEQCLSEQNKTQIMDFIKSRRQTKVIKEVKRTYDKVSNDE